MARTPRGLHVDCGVSGRDQRLGGKLLQRGAQVRGPMKIVLIGVNHKTAPIEVRERFAVPESRLPYATRRLAQYPGIEEAMIVSTCNRVEFLARTTNGATPDLRGYLRDYFGDDVRPFE